MAKKPGVGSTTELLKECVSALDRLRLNPGARAQRKLAALVSGKVHKYLEPPVAPAEAKD